MAGVTRALVLVALAAPAAAAADRRYLEDFEFLDRTVREHAAALERRRIDWDEVVSRLRPAFAKCASDAEHVKNVLELLACVQDSHTGVTRSSVPWDQLPGKFDGLYGGGLWFGNDAGTFVLRGVMKDHPLAGQVEPGAVLVAIDGLPAWLAMARERARIARWIGISSDHSLFASLGNRMLPFGERQRLPLTFLLPDGKLREVEVTRWGPGGKAFSWTSVQIPDGVELGEGAAAGFLDVPGTSKVGYLRITGGMDAETARAFHAALDRLQGMEALLLDCRGMGGGGDAPAWEMAGRFFEKGADNGRNGRIEPSGSWQFTGPVVMLQDELMVSSAETFTWAMSETGRAVTVGRPTGGWGIIPRGFSCPSGLVDFRLGVTDRPTPIRGVHTEGVGWPPDVMMPLGPAFCAVPDPDRMVALEILRVLAAGAERDAVRTAFAALFAGRLDEFRRSAGSFERTARGFSADRLIAQVRDDLAGELDLARKLARLEDGLADWDALERRLPGLEARAKAAGLAKDAAALKKALSAAGKERAAQQALLELVAARALDDPKARDAWLARHGKTSLCRGLRERLWP